MLSTPIENMRLSNIQLRFHGGVEKNTGTEYPELDKKYPEIAKFLGQCPAYAIYMRHVKDIDLSHITVRLERLDHRHAVMMEDAENVQMEHMDIPEQEGVQSIVVL